MINYLSLIHDSFATPQVYLKSAEIKFISSIYLLYIEDV